MNLNRRGEIFLEQKENDTTFKANISDEKWITYFKSIFYDPSKQMQVTRK